MLIKGFGLFNKLKRFTQEGGILVRQKECFSCRGARLLSSDKITAFNYKADEKTSDFWTIGGVGDVIRSCVQAPKSVVLP